MCFQIGPKEEQLHLVLCLAIYSVTNESQRGGGGLLPETFMAQLMKSEDDNGADTSRRDWLPFKCANKSGEGAAGQGQVCV